MDKIVDFLPMLHFYTIWFPNALFLSPLKTPENRKVFGCFQGLEKGCIKYKWVNVSYK